MTLPEGSGCATLLQNCDVAIRCTRTRSGGSVARRLVDTSPTLKADVLHTAGALSLLGGLKCPANEMKHSWTSVKLDPAELDSAFGLFAAPNGSFVSGMDLFVAGAHSIDGSQSFLGRA